MLRIVESSSYNPYFNLALEECLFHNCEESDDIILYLWQNDNTVVVGRNQTVYTECNLDYARKHNVKIARRMTGGGTVYHDLGNLNYTIIVPHILYNHSYSTRVVVNALSTLEINAEVNGRNDIFYDGLKISGNAYYSTERAGLHHGTLLVDVNLNHMFNLLNVPGSKMSKVGISSVKSRVKNLNEVCNSTLEEIKTAIITSFIEQYGANNDVLYGYEVDKNPMFDDLYAKYSSDQWTMDQVRDFSIIVEGQFLWGNAKLSCEIDGNKVSKYSISSDSLYPDVISSIEGMMNQSQCFLVDTIINQVSPNEKKIIKDLYNLQLKLLGLVQED